MISAFWLIAGCASTADVGVGHRVEIPKDSATKCSSLCGSIGLTLDSVVVMASNVGCVCRAAPAVPVPPGTSTTSVTAAASGGMAALLLLEQQQQQQRGPQQIQPPRSQQPK